jgi:hypothetical protein
MNEGMAIGDEQAIAQWKLDAMLQDTQSLQAENAVLRKLAGKWKP